ncbi:MAG: hypothetical protein WCQ99_11410 [Pseudomonadota bacterium]
MAIPGNLLTTAMAVMPHADVDQALNAALSLDVPFWPQLPLFSYYEDMYVQASEHFPGIQLHMVDRTVRFSFEKFIEEIEDATAHFEQPEYFDISPAYSAVYHRFLGLDLADRPAIRGQLEGPVSLGLNILDEDKRPIIFNDTVRPFMLEFLARRVNVQLQKLKKCNPNAFMFIDEPGLQFVFSGMSGYSDVAAKRDLETFFSLAERPLGIHLCGNPDWDFLLTLDINVLSLDTYSNGEIFTSYPEAIRAFLDRGGIIVWGCIPTNSEPFEKETVASCESRLTGLWNKLIKSGIDRDLLVSQSMLSPATCCLVNADRERTVEKAFALTKELSARLRAEYFRN